MSLEIFNWGVAKITLGTTALEHSNYRFFLNYGSRIAEYEC